MTECLNFGRVVSSLAQHLALPSFLCVCAAHIKPKREIDQNQSSLLAELELSRCRNHAAEVLGPPVRLGPTLMHLESEVTATRRWLEHHPKPPRSIAVFGDRSINRPLITATSDLAGAIEDECVEWIW